MIYCIQIDWPGIMNLSKASCICVFLIAALSAGCAAKSPPYTSFHIRGAVSSNSKIFFSVKDRVGFIQGVVETQLDKVRLTREALKLDGVDEVRNHVRVSF